MGVEGVLREEALRDATVQQLHPRARVQVAQQAPAQGFLGLGFSFLGFMGFGFSMLGFLGLGSR